MSVVLRLGRNSSADEDESILDLRFVACNTLTAKRWVYEIGRANEKGLNIKYPDRTYGFPGDTRTVSSVSCDILNCVDAINRYRPGTILPLDENNHNTAFTSLGQNDLNRLHKYFEVLRGDCDHPAEFFIHAPHTIREVLMDFNLYIHRLEEMLRTPFHPRIVVAWDHARRRRTLEESDIFVVFPQTSRIRPCLRKLLPCRETYFGDVPGR
eukprot:PhF_6_TR41357/c1_g1_i3/m.62816